MHNILGFNGEECLAPRPSPSWRTTLWRFQYIRGHPPYLEAISSSTSLPESNEEPQMGGVCVRWGLEERPIEIFGGLTRG